MTTTQDLDWQPIETAPKDGTPVLTWDGAECMVLAYYDDGTPDYYQPTHWMPLPHPPSNP